LGSQAFAVVFDTEVQELPAGQNSLAQVSWSHVEALPQMRRQRLAPPWIGLQTASSGH
jgi:hypothetical protein